MLKKVLIGFAAVVVVFVTVVALQPSDFRVTRSATMAAPPADVFAQVNDFHKWGEWSPWAKMDPNAKNSFEGPESGVGAKMAWSGNDKVGEGDMEILESRPVELVRLKLTFLKPHASTADTVFDVKPEGSGTTLTWTMSGKNDFIGRAFCLFINMDKMVGGDFEKGLAAIKSLVENPKRT